MGAKKKASAKKKAGKPLVIVESPAKARTISRFLGGAYSVQASIGHVRDLPRKASELPEGAQLHRWLGVRELSVADAWKKLGYE